MFSIGLSGKQKGHFSMKKSSFVSVPKNLLKDIESHQNNLNNLITWEMSNPFLNCRGNSRKLKDTQRTDQRRPILLLFLLSTTASSAIDRHRTVNNFLYSGTFLDI